MAVFLRCCLFSLHVVQFVYDWAIKIFCGEQKKECLPPITDPLLKLSATALARKIRRKEISSLEVVTAYIARVKQVNPIINAVVEDSFVQALDKAKEIDEYLGNNNVAESDLENKKPWLGIPVTVKECIAVKGLSYTGCSKTREGIKADFDADVVELVKSAGAIPILVSNTPEYCTSVETSNKITGYTCNPYNSLCSSGGSSGGEGALIGAGASIMGIGSDIAGSIRIPAAFNGIFGHKPTSGLISLKGHFPLRYDKNFNDYLVIGPLTRFAEDLPLALRTMAGENVDKLHLDKKVNISDLNVYYMEDANSNFGVQYVDVAIKGAIKQAVDYLQEKFCCTVHDRKFQGISHSVEFFSALVFRSDNPPNVLTDSETKYNLYVEILKSMLGISIFTGPSIMYSILQKTNFLVSDKTHKHYQEEAEKLKEEFVNVLGDDGIFIYPSFPTAAFPRGGFLSGSASSSYPAIFNVLGLPATCVPVGLNGDQLPVGIQVIAGPNNDRLGLAVAQELEKCFGGWKAPS